MPRPVKNETMFIDEFYTVLHLETSEWIHQCSVERASYSIYNSVQCAYAELQDILNRTYDPYIRFDKFQKIKKTHVITSILYLYDSSNIFIFDIGYINIHIFRLTRIILLLILFYKSCSTFVG